VKAFTRSSILTLCLVAPVALAGSDLTITVDAPQLTTPLRILNTTTYGCMSVAKKICSRTSCTFTVTEANFWHWQSDPNNVKITLGKDDEHACTFTFNDNGGFLHKNARLDSILCSDGWTSSNLENSHVLLSFSE
jgi:hypothetical protein